MKEIRIKDGERRIPVVEALRLVADAAEFEQADAVVDVFVEIERDEAGNERVKDGGATSVALRDGNMQMLEQAEAAFMGFCRTNGVIPRPNANPWATDYTGTALQTYQYRITADELALFAAGYGIKVIVDGASTEAPEQEVAPAPKGRQRHDDIQIEIDDVTTELKRRGERPNPAKVMAQLKERAGCANSCISEAFDDGVIWIRGSSGKPERLTHSILKSRMYR